MKSADNLFDKHRKEEETISISSSNGRGHRLAPYVSQLTSLIPISYFLLSSLEVRG